MGGGPVALNTTVEVNLTGRLTSDATTITVRVYGSGTVGWPPFNSCSTECSFTVAPEQLCASLPSRRTQGRVSRLGRLPGRRSRRCLFMHSRRDVTIVAQFDPIVTYGRTGRHVAVPSEPHTITVVVPALPERAGAPKRAAERKQADPPMRQNRSKAAPAPTVSREYAEPPSQSSPRSLATAAKPEQPAKAARACESCEGGEETQAGEGVSLDASGASTRLAPSSGPCPGPDADFGVLAASSHRPRLTRPPRRATPCSTSRWRSPVFSRFRSRSARRPRVSRWVAAGLRARRATEGATRARCRVGRLRGDHLGAHLGTYRLRRQRGSSRSTDAVNHPRVIGQATVHGSWCPSDIELAGLLRWARERSRRTNGAYGGPGRSPLSSEALVRRCLLDLDAKARSDRARRLALDQHVRSAITQPPPGRPRVRS